MVYIDLGLFVPAKNERITITQLGGDKSMLKNLYLTVVLAFASLIEKFKPVEQAKVRKSDMLSLNLQFFADGDPDPGNNDPDSGADPDPGKDPDGGADPNKQDPPVKTFTQEDVNGLVAKEAKKAQEKLLKQLGVTDIKSAKEGLDKFQAHLDSQKDEATKTADKLAVVEGERNTLGSENETLKAQLAALKADVKADSIDDVIVLAKPLVSEDVTMEEAIQKVTEKYPQFKKEDPAAKEDEQQKPPKFSNGDHKQEKPTENQQWANAFSWGKTTN